MAMDDVRVASWAELQERLYEGSWREPLGRFRSSFAFRGMSHAAHGLKTSLMRLGGAYERHEAHLLRNFRKYAQRAGGLEDSVWNWLALAQHHGLPTRLLDWTFSPFVALHNATADPRRFGADGVVWCVDYVRANESLPGALRQVLEEEGSDVFTAEMLARAAGTLAEFDRLATDDFVVFFEPPSLDDRIVNQFALFSLMSRPAARLDRWLAGHPHRSRRIVIPAALKWEVRDKLDQANITERVLFPGLDGLSLWLKRYYSPNPRSPAPDTPPDEMTAPEVRHDRG
jgi:FRG domain